MKKPAREQELSEDDLERVSGGATFSVFTKVDSRFGEGADKHIPAVNIAQKAFKPI